MPALLTRTSSATITLAASMICTGGPDGWGEYASGGGRAGQPGIKRGFRAPYRPVPGRAAGTLLPHARLGSRRRGPGAGDDAAGVALFRPVRGPRVAADLAVP